MTKYTINEKAARAANYMNSFRTYQEGSATAEYNASCQNVFTIAEEQKAKVDPMYHDKIDNLVETYCRKLAANTNKGFEIDSRYPSVMISGAGNFNNRKKEKQNAAREKNWEERKKIEAIISKIKGVGTAGISSDDPNAIAKLQKKLESLQELHEVMKSVNVYYRKHKTLEGCQASEEVIASAIRNLNHIYKVPFPTYVLSYNNAEIKRIKERIETLKKAAERTSGVLWKFEGGYVEANTEDNRLRVFFDDIPTAETRQQLKSNAFKWSPKAGAWQRQLTNNAIYTAKNFIPAIKPS